MKAERSCGGSLIEPRGHSRALHQHPALLKPCRAAGGGCRGHGGDQGTSGSFLGSRSMELRPLGSDLLTTSEHHVTANGV